MSIQKARLGPAIGIAVAFLLAAMITIAAFLALGSPVPSERPSGFYIWMAVALAAEFVLFAWTANWYFSSRSEKKVTGAVVVVIHVMIVIWLAVTLYTAFSIAGPKKTIDSIEKKANELIDRYVMGETVDTASEQPANRFNDPISFIYMALTLVFFLGASSLYSLDAAYQERDLAINVERKQVRASAPDAEHACSVLKKLAGSNPDMSVRIDRLAKRLEGIGTDLQYAPPAKPGAREEPGGLSVADINEEIAGEIDLLMPSLSSLEGGEGSAEAVLREIEDHVARLELLTQRRRQRLLA